MERTDLVPLGGGGGGGGTAEYCLEKARKGVDRMAVLVQNKMRCRVECVIVCVGCGVAESFKKMGDREKATFFPGELRETKHQVGKRFN